MDKICQNCGRPNPPDALFCRHCASTLPEANAPAGNINQSPNRQQNYQQNYQQNQYQNQPPNQYQNQSPGQYQNQPWNQQNMGGNQMGGNVAAFEDKASGRAIGSAVLAAVSLFCCGIFAGMPAILLGWLELAAIKEGRASQKGMLFAQIGFWGGIAGSIITTLIGLILTLLGGRG